jgi:hypothetical protein
LPARKLLAGFSAYSSWPKTCYTEFVTLKLAKKDQWSLLKVVSGICGNLSAAWFGFILISPGINQLSNPADLATLTRSLIFGILFMLIAFKIERSSS